MGWSAFRPLGPTVAISVTVAASTGVQALPSQGESMACNYVVSNSTSQACFLSIGTDATTATANAVIPTGGAPTNTLYLGPNSTQTFTFGPKTFFATIAAATTSIVYITPGDGL